MWLLHTVSHDCPPVHPAVPPYLLRSAAALLRVLPCPPCCVAAAPADSPCLPVMTQACSHGHPVKPKQEQHRQHLFHHEPVEFSWPFNHNSSLLLEVCQSMPPDLAEGNSPWAAITWSPSWALLSLLHSSGWSHAHSRQRGSFLGAQCGSWVGCAVLAIYKHIQTLHQWGCTSQGVRQARYSQSQARPQGTQQGCCLPCQAVVAAPPKPP
jgi:biotin operon repressor